MAAPVGTGVSLASANEEERLIALAKQRDHRAWATLFDRYYPLLFRYARARLGSVEEAEDMTSEAFIKAFKAVDRFNDQGQPMIAWLYTITRNLVNKRWHQLRRDGSSSFETRSGTGSEQDAVERLDLFRSLRQLNDQQREVVILRLSLGMSLRETALVLKKSPAAIHSLQTRALENLRRLLHE